ncbi:MAG: hypothetical protein H0W83_14000 [Planctomycetes bacterium]|nr:hypothetical protein [Planctomycetota bacterium]
MKMTHEQKADNGIKYINAIKDRIATREAARKRAIDSSLRTGWVEEDENGPASGKMVAIVKALAKKHRFGDGPTAKVEVTSEYNTLRQSRDRMVCLYFHDGSSMKLPVESVPGLAEVIEEGDKAKTIARDLCQEIEFLHGMLSPARVAAFQAHAARLWAPDTKAEIIAPVTLKGLVEDFITAARPVTCKVA